MALDGTYILGEQWSSTFSLYNADGDLVNGSDVRVVFRRWHDGSTFTYALGSDAEVTQTGSGGYLFQTDALATGVYDVEWQATGTNAERVRATVRIKQDL